MDLKEIGCRLYSSSSGQGHFQAVVNNVKNLPVAKNAVNFLNY